MNFFLYKLPLAKFLDAQLRLFKEPITCQRELTPLPAGTHMANLRVTAGDMGRAAEKICSQFNEHCKSAKSQ